MPPTARSASKSARTVILESVELACRCMAVALLVAAIGWPGPARAHSELVSSSPGAGAEVPMSTDRIVLVFDAALSPVGNAVIVRGPDSDDVSAAASQVSGNSIEMQIDLVAPGRHTVSYRFVGQDGHAASGRLWFAAVAGGAPHSSATAVFSAGTPPADAQVNARAGTTSAAGDAQVWLLPLVGLTGGLLLLYSAAAARQRRHATTSTRS